MIYAPPAPPPLVSSSQIAFVGPEGMMVQWDAYTPGAFDSEPLVMPGRFNFPQAAIYRLKLTNIPGRPGVELYPTLEIGPATPRTEPYLTHNPIPFQLTEEDLDQVLSGNFVTKVIYLPDAEYQELALAGVETLVSTRLDPGVDPIVEADRRGTIMAIIRVGNIDLEVPGGNGGNSVGPLPMTGAAPCCPPGLMGPPMGGGGCCPPGMGGMPMGGMPMGGMPMGGMPMGGMPMGGMEGAGMMAGPGMMAGMAGPQYGIPITGTPIGLPGPPHVPLGVPAGLQKHTMKNHTFMHIPEPVDQVKVHVQQSPGMNYPQPPKRVFIQEHAKTSWWPFHQQVADRRQAANLQTYSTSSPPGIPAGAACVSDAP
jgi:hypothetical protein